MRYLRQAQRKADPGERATAVVNAPARFKDATKTRTINSIFPVTGRPLPYYYVQRAPLARHAFFSSSDEIVTAFKGSLPRRTKTGGEQATDGLTGRLTDCLTNLVNGHLELFHGAAVPGSPDVLQARKDVVPADVDVREKSCNRTRYCIRYVRKYHETQRL